MCKSRLWSAETAQATEAGGNHSEEASKTSLQRDSREEVTRMETESLQSQVREIISEAFSHGKYAGQPFGSLVQPTKSYGVRAGSEAEMFALRLAVGAARAVDRLARELDGRSPAGK